MLNILTNLLLVSVVFVVSCYIIKELIYDPYFSLKNVIYRVMSKKTKKTIEFDLMIKDFKLVTIPITFYMENECLMMETDNIYDYHLEKISKFLDSQENLSENDVVISYLDNSLYFNFKNNEIIPTDDLLALITLLEIKLDLPKLKKNLRG